MYTTNTKQTNNSLLYQHIQAHSSAFCKNEMYFWPCGLAFMNKEMNRIIFLITPCTLMIYQAWSRSCKDKDMIPLKR